MSVQLKKKFCLKSLNKFMEGKKTVFLIEQTKRKTLLFMPKYRMKVSPQTNYALVFQRKEGSILSYHIPKIPKALNKTKFRTFKI